MDDDSYIEQLKQTIAYLKQLTFEDIQEDDRKGETIRKPPREPQGEGEPCRRKR